MNTLNEGEVQKEIAVIRGAEVYGLLNRQLAELLVAEHARANLNNRLFNDWMGDANHFQVDRLLNCVAEGKGVFVTSGGEIVGMMTFDFVPSWNKTDSGLIELNDLVVLPEFRNNGLGRTLFSDQVNFLKNSYPEYAIYLKTKRLGVKRMARQLGFRYDWQHHVFGVQYSPESLDADNSQRQCQLEKYAADSAAHGFINYIYIPGDGEDANGMENFLREMRQHFNGWLSKLNIG
jgi:GNAT superfamily N-acetyltransferase